MILMCAYAGEVFRGEHPGPYTNRNARAFAQAALIPDSLLDRDERAFGIPARELADARRDR